MYFCIINEYTTFLRKIGQTVGQRSTRVMRIQYVRYLRLSSVRKGMNITGWDEETMLLT